MGVSSRTHTLRFVLAVGGILVSAYMTWAAWRGPPPRSFAPTPKPVDRTATSEEISEVNRVAEAMTQQFRQNHTAGVPLILENLLTGPIPDNPLVEGVGTSMQSCDEQPQVTVDWLVCTTTMTVRAVIPR